MAAERASRSNVAVTISSLPEEWTHGGKWWLTLPLAIRVNFRETSNPVFFLQGNQPWTLDLCLWQVGTVFMDTFKKGFPHGSFYFIKLRYGLRLSSLEWKKEKLVGNICFPRGKTVNALCHIILAANILNGIQPLHVWICSVCVCMCVISRFFMHPIID